MKATNLAIDWCDFLERHASKAYQIDKSTNALAVKNLSQAVKSGMVPHASTVRSIYRKQWSMLKTPQVVEYALENLEEANWVKVVQATVKGGKSRRIMIHPNLRKSVGGVK